MNIKSIVLGVAVGAANLVSSTSHATGVSYPLLMPSAATSSAREATNSSIQVEFVHTSGANTVFEIINISTTNVGDPLTMLLLTTPVNQISEIQLTCSSFSTVQSGSTIQNTYSVGTGAACTINFATTLH